MAKRKTNPFKPTAGAEPPVLVGRDKVIRDFADGLDEGVGAPGRLMRITGPRGSGKTVLLTELGDIARRRGWTVVDETARKGFLDGIMAALNSAAPEARASLGVNLGVVKAQAEVSREDKRSDFRSVLTSASDRLGKSGVMITVDEVQDADRDDMVEIATAVQHLIREGRDVVFVFAGITTGVMDFINDSSLAFLRRAKAEELGPTPVNEVALALRESFVETGMSVDQSALDDMAKATCGYAYLVQLVGYNVWRECRSHLDVSPKVMGADVAIGVKAAVGDYEEMVIEPAIKSLSERAMRYLVEMSKREGASSTRAVAEAMQVPSTSLTSTRRTLISRQIIESTARGSVDFSVPLMREYVRDNAEELMGRFGC